LSGGGLEGKRLLVANRGEIALRVVRTCRTLGVTTVAAHSEADASMPFVAEADEAVLLGPAPARDSYLSVGRVVEAARNARADAVHPGYGFLSENPDLAESVEQAGIAFVGPRAETIRRMGNKVRAKEAATKAGVPVTAGSGNLRDAAEAAEAAARLGYPVLLKAAAGGGGRGMRVVESPRDLEGEFRTAAAEAKAAFGKADLFLERVVRPARHLEVQVFGDGKGRVVALGERECSIQRRHQKVIEEAPSPAVDAALRARLCSSAAALAESVSYRGAGTVEFLLGPEGRFQFLEVNCRLQVEHPVTEMVYGVDLVAAQVRLALTGEMPPFPPPEPRGWAVESRVCAEDPALGFAPSTGPILAVQLPRGSWVRWDGGYAAGNEVTPHYDSLLGKLVAWGATRGEAVARSIQALRQVAILGPRTNTEFLRAVLDHPRFREGRLSTSFLGEEFPEAWRPPSGGAGDGDAALVAAAAWLLLRDGPAEAGGASGPAAGGASPWNALPGWRVRGGGAP
jgi:acetyl/propionyl-CoA carboxylase alpha subunit